MKFISVSILLIAVLGFLAHIGGLWIVHSRQTAGFAVELRNREYVSPDMAHTLGFSTHVVGILLSVFVGVGTISMMRRPQPRLCLALALGVSIPALSPMFGLALPLGILAIIAQWRSTRRGRLPSTDV